MGNGISCMSFDDVQVNEAPEKIEMAKKAVGTCQDLVEPPELKAKDILQYQLIHIERYIRSVIVQGFLNIYKGGLYSDPNYIDKYFGYIKKYYESQLEFTPNELIGYCAKYFSDQRLAYELKNVILKNIHMFMHRKLPIILSYQVSVEKEQAIDFVPLEFSKRNKQLSHL